MLSRPVPALTQHLSWLLTSRPQASRYTLVRGYVFDLESRSEAGHSVS